MESQQTVPSGGKTLTMRYIVNKCLLSKFDKWSDDAEGRHNSTKKKSATCLISCTCSRKKKVAYFRLWNTQYKVIWSLATLMSNLFFITHYSQKKKERRKSQICDNCCAVLFIISVEEIVRGVASPLWQSFSKEHICLFLHPLFTVPSKSGTEQTCQLGNKPCCRNFSFKWFIREQAFQK